MAKLRKSLRKSRRRKSPKVVMVCSPMRKRKSLIKKSKRRSKSLRKKRSRKRSRKDGSCGCSNKKDKDGCDYGFETE